MKIFDEEQAWLPTTPPLHQPREQRTESALTGLGVHALSRALGVRHGEEVEQERERFGELRVEQEYRAGDLPAGRLVVILFGDAEEPAQELENGEEGNPFSRAGRSGPGGRRGHARGSAR